jgi:hypothetical protein
MRTSVMDRRQVAYKYMVACCTPGCDWHEEHESLYVARVASQQHQRETAGHKAVVFPPGEEQKIAA